MRNCKSGALLLAMVMLVGLWVAPSALATDLATENPNMGECYGWPLPATP
jgi:hypothetical protein